MKSKSSSPTIRRFQPYASDPTNNDTSSPLISSSASAPHDGTVFARPFDRFKFRGGGPQGDIFRRFKIRKAEEQDFLFHWAGNRISSGVLTRDTSNTLVFRVSASDSSDLSILGIGRITQGSGDGIEWAQVYDEEGVPWLTQFRCINLVEEVSHDCGKCGRSSSSIGRLGRYGPSGLTPADFYARMMAEQGRQNTDKVGIDAATNRLYTVA